MALSGAAEKAHTRIGFAGPERKSAVEAGHLRRWCEAIGDPNPRWREEAPPTFLAALGAETLEFPEALAYGSGWLNGGDRFEYREPVRAGDTVTCRTTLSDVYEKEGSAGPMLFLVTETRFHNQHGRHVGTVTGTRIRR